MTPVKSESKEARGVDMVGCTELYTQRWLVFVEHVCASLVETIALSVSWFTPLDVHLTHPFHVTSYAGGGGGSGQMFK